MTDATDPTLFDPPTARRRDPSTAHRAAASITPGRTEGKIVAAMEPGDVLTPDEICDRLPGCHPPTVKTAIARCVDAGFLIADGEGTSHRGRACITWRRTDRSMT